MGMTILEKKWNGGQLPLRVLSVKFLNNTCSIPDKVAIELNIKRQDYISLGQDDKDKRIFYIWKVAERSKTAFKLHISGNRLGFSCKAFSDELSRQHPDKKSVRLLISAITVNIDGLDVYKLMPLK